MQLFANNATSTLAVAITSGATTVQVQPGEGDKFPNPSGGDFFLVTIYQRVGATELNHDIAKCTARAGDVLTIVRNIEGKTPRAYAMGDFIELRMTAGAVLPVCNGALTGALNEAPTKSLPIASALPIGASGANSITITGDGPITQFDSIGQGAVRRTTFTGAAVLTQNPAYLNLISSANITTQPGDWAEWISQGNGVWQMMSFTRANGAALVADASKASLGANTFTAAQQYNAVAKGSVASGTVTFSMAAGNVQSLTVAGTLTIALSNLPAAGVFGDILIKLSNGGTATVTLPTIKWVMPNGAIAASFAAYLAAIGRTSLQAAGIDFMYLWVDDGANVYGKLL